MSARVVGSTSSTRLRSTVTLGKPSFSTLHQERDATKQRLQERHREVGATDRPDDTRKAGTAPDVVHNRLLPAQVGDDGAVEQVTLPDPRGFAGTEKPTRDRVSNEKLCVVHRRGKSLAEENPRHLGASPRWGGTSDADGIWPRPA